VREKLIHYNGKTQNISAWAKELGMSRQQAWERLQQHRVSDALRDPDGRRVVRMRRLRKYVLVEGHQMWIADAAKHFAVSVSTIKNWITAGRLTAYQERVRVCSVCNGEAGEPGHVRTTCPLTARGQRKRMEAAGALVRVRTASGRTRLVAPPK